MGSRRRSFVVLYTLSGAAGLVYEVTWTRLLTLQLGHTVAAASTVLAAFMAGLAAGAWVAGAKRSDSLLRAYALLEVFVALAALALPLVLRLSVPMLAWAYADGEAPARFALVRVALSFVLVGVPAAAMGATFPITSAWLARVEKSSGDSLPAGVLYAANTTGAAAGAIAAGFWLIPALGLRGTTWVGVALNAIAAGGALWLARDSRAEHAEPAEPTTRKKKSDQTLRAQRALRDSRALRESPAPVLACAAAAVSGFSALAYEVVWTRLLALVIGPTTYAFATMAASFIGGLAIGSAAGARIARRAARPVVWLAGFLIIGPAAATIAAWYTATRLPLVVAGQVADPSVDFGSLVLRQALTVAILLLPMTFALGASFPLALAVAGHDESSVARDTARVYAANTTGAIAGALAAGFLLIPALGLRDTIRVAAALAIAGGVACFAAGRSAEAVALHGPGTKDGRRTKNQGPSTIAVAAAAAIAACVVVLAMPAWDRALLASGAYKYAPYLGAIDLDAVLRAGTLEYYKEGPSATVSVRSLTGTRSLAIDGKVDASNAGDMLTQRLLGLLPVLVHGNARDVAVIGLGSGVTVGSALAPGTVRTVDVVEISPEVVEASRFFDEENDRALSRPGVRLIVGDGRSHLLLSPRQYDVIISEPSNPWMAGVASLFTREFFEAARARLKPNGLICQWAHTYDIHPEDLRSIVRTFASVFPQGSLWLVGGGDLLLVGARDGDIEPRLAAIETGARAGTVDAALADVGAAPGTAPLILLSLFAGGPQDMARFADGGALQTDDRTALEYSAPRGIYGRTKEDNAVAIRALKPVLPPAVSRTVERADDRAWAARGTVDLRAQAFATAYEAFRRAVTLNSRNAEALAGLSDAAGGANRLDEERTWLREIASREPGNATVRIELSRVLAVTGDARGAADAAMEATRIAPDDPRAAEQLASVLADSSDVGRLTPLAEALIAKFPDRPDSRYYLATALFLSGRVQDAVVQARRVVDGHPGHARAQGLLGAACAAAGQRDCAQSAFEASVRDNPRDPSGYINAGLFHLQVQNPSAAADDFAQALAIDPSSTAARDGLARARAVLQQR